MRAGREIAWSGRRSAGWTPPSQLGEGPWRLEVADSRERGQDPVLNQASATDKHRSKPAIYASQAVASCGRIAVLMFISQSRAGASRRTTQDS